LNAITILPAKVNCIQTSCSFVGCSKQSRNDLRRSNTVRRLLKRKRERVVYHCKGLLVFSLIWKLYRFFKWCLYLFRRVSPSRFYLFPWNMCNMRGHSSKGVKYFSSCLSECLAFLFIWKSKEFVEWFLNLGATTSSFHIALNPFLYFILSIEITALR
jgi:hypothetical protein